MNSTINRRSFLGTGTLVGAGLAVAPLFAATINKGTRKLKVGLIGAGGRGKGALNDFKEACKFLNLEVEVTAVGDAFKQVAEGAGRDHGVPAERCFGGFDNYHKVIATDCDFVVMATPPSFRPLHLDAAVAAGKHCFIEKPVAVDPVGARAIIATGEKAKAKGLGIVAGTQRRHTDVYQRNKALIDAGAIGAIKGGVVTWNGTVPWIKRRNEGESEADYMARNWLNFAELSGDHIVEQHVHNLDVAVWFLGKLPISAVGFGGRARRETGDMFDFFSVDLDFGDGVHIHSQCRQIEGTYQGVGEMFTGCDGICYGGGKVTGKKVQVPEFKMDVGNAYVQEHIDLIRSVMAGKPLNETKTVAESTLVAIMGRMSAYTGNIVMMRNLLENDKSPDYNFACVPSALDFEKGTVKMPAEVPAVPGK